MKKHMLCHKSSKWKLVSQAWAQLSKLCEREQLKERNPNESKKQTKHELRSRKMCESFFWWQEIWRTLPEFFHVLLTNLQFCLKKKDKDVVFFFFRGSGRKHLQREQVFGGHFWCLTELRCLCPFPLVPGAALREASYRTVRKGLVMRRLCEEKALFGELVASGCY